MSSAAVLIGALRVSLKKKKVFLKAFAFRKNIFVYLRAEYILKKALSTRIANMKPRKVFPFAKKAVKYGYSKDRVKHDSFRVFNAFVTRFSCVCMKRVLKRVDSRFSRYKRVSQQPIKSALQKREKNAFGPDFAQKISTNQKHLFAFANDVENAKIANPSWPIRS